jgi:hypothetical protein
MDNRRRLPTACPPPDHELAPDGCFDHKATRREMKKQMKTTPELTEVDRSD